MELKTSHRRAQSPEKRSADGQGSYLTDGVRLFCLVGGEDEYGVLEDAQTYCIEFVPRKTLKRLRRVTPRSDGSDSIPPGRHG